MAQKRLVQELVPLQKEKWLLIDMDERNMLKWYIGLWVVNPESVFHGAFLKCEMRFPPEYPYQPPSFRFLTKDITHPNVYSDGNLCISILHKPGDDEQSGEAANERWNVLHGVESVLRSVLLLMDDPEINSPANVDASLLYRDNRAKYNALARHTVERTQQDIPEGVMMPTAADLVPMPQKVIEDDDNFWNPSDDELDFGGSDSDAEDFEEEEEDDDEDDGAQDE